jgi:uncharacterized protein with HEPN domain
LNVSKESKNTPKESTRETFLKDQLRIDAVDANLRNIGEAMRVLSKNNNLKSKFYHYHIPYKMLSDIRTELTHEYFSSDPNAMWNMAANILPNLKVQFAKVIQDL